MAQKRKNVAIADLQTAKSLIDLQSHSNSNSQDSPGCASSGSSYSTISGALTEAPIIVTAWIPECAVVAPKRPKMADPWPLHMLPNNKVEFDQWWESFFHQFAGSSPAFPFEYLRESSTASIAVSWLLARLHQSLLPNCVLSSVYKLLTPAITGEEDSFFGCTSPGVSVFCNWPDEDRLDDSLLKRKAEIRYCPARNGYESNRLITLGELLLELVIESRPILNKPVDGTPYLYQIDLSCQWKTMAMFQACVETTLATCMSYYYCMKICGVTCKVWHHLQPDEKGLDDATRAILTVIDKRMPGEDLTIDEFLFMKQHMALHDTRGILTNKDLGKILNHSDPLRQAYCVLKTDLLRARIKRWLPFDRLLLYMLERVRVLPKTWGGMLRMALGFVGCTFSCITSTVESVVLEKQQRMVELHFGLSPPTASRKTN